MGMTRKREPGLVPLDGGRWRVVARVRVNGKIVHRRETLKGTKESARDRLYWLKREIRDGVCGGSLSRRASKLSTCGDLLTVYADGRGFSKSHSQKIDRLRDELGDVPLEHCPDRLRQLVALYRTRGRGVMANRFVEIIRAAYAVAIELELVDRNPITKAAFPRVKEIPRDVVLSTADQLKIINTAQAMERTRHLVPAIRFAMQVPTRRSELIGMTRDDLDLVNNSIRIRNGTTKTDRGRWVPIPPDMVGYFRRLPADSSWLFYRRVGGTKRRPNVEYRRLGDFKKAWHTVRDRAGFPGLRVHDLRHVSATALVNAGTPEAVVNDVAGWRSNMLRVYYNRTPQTTLRAVRFEANCEHTVNTADQNTG